VVREVGRGLPPFTPLTHSLPSPLHAPHSRTHIHSLTLIHSLIHSLTHSHSLQVHPPRLPEAPLEDSPLAEMGPWGAVNSNHLSHSLATFTHSPIHSFTFSLTLTHSFTHALTFTTGVSSTTSHSSTMEDSPLAEMGPWGVNSVTNRAPTIHSLPHPPHSLIHAFTYSHSLQEVLPRLPSVAPLEDSHLWKWNRGGQ
jgi:hypothetical protein